MPGQSGLGLTAGKPAIPALTHPCAQPAGSNSDVRSGVQRLPVPVSDQCRQGGDLATTSTGVEHLGCSIESSAQKSRWWPGDPIANSQFGRPKSRVPSLHSGPRQRPARPESSLSTAAGNRAQRGLPTPETRRRRRRNDHRGSNVPDHNSDVRIECRAGSFRSRVDGRQARNTRARTPLRPAGRPHFGRPK